MAKFFVLSDIHIDQYLNCVGYKNMVDMYEKYLSKIGDIGERTLICAGDVSGDMGGWTQASFLFDKFKKVILVLGNHDMVRVMRCEKDNAYCSKLMNEKVYETTESKIEWIKNYVKEMYPNVILLDGECIDYEGVKIGGTFGWYDFLDDESPLDEMDWKDWFDGYYWNYYNNNLKTIAYNEVKKMKKVLDQKPDIFVTHVAHASCNTNPIYRGSNSNKFFYYSPDEYELEGCKRIICGHTHDSVLKNENGQIIMCNPMGYADEKSPLALNNLKVEDFLFEV